ncbi:MAG: DedA family protein [Deltaproteobacteria bacterium]|nr:DedA family protein [Deltaproteobacteria bacterium]
MKFIQRWMDWLWDVAGRKGAEKVLMVVSFTESIFFPIPPDLLLIPMGLARRDRVFRYAGICLVLSILGGVFGYLIGQYFMEAIGDPIIAFYGLTDKYGVVQEWYREWSAWAVVVAGLTPIPYKLCTLTAGAFRIDWPTFVLASILSRGLRFFLIALFIHFFGEQARYFLAERFNLVVSATLVLVILGFAALKLI